MSKDETGGFSVPASLEGVPPSGFASPLPFGGPPPRWQPESEDGPALTGAFAKVVLKSDGDWLSVISHEIETLGQWGELNQKDAKRDLVSFWSLKIPAIAASASTALFQAFDLGWVSVILGTVAAVCISIDAMRPRGALYNAHVAAAHELALVALESATEVSRIKLSDEETRVPMALALLTRIEQQRRGIATRLKVAESAVRTYSSPPPSGTGTHE